MTENAHFIRCSGCGYWLLEERITIVYTQAVCDNCLSFRKPVEKPTQADLAETDIDRHLRHLAAKVETLEIPPQLKDVEQKICEILDEAASQIETLAWSVGQ